MKKFGWFFLLLIPAFAMAQMRPGRYIIKLAHNGRVIQSGGTGSAKLTTIAQCPNPAEGCQNQIWEVKSVRDKPQLFTITKVANRLLLTFKEKVNDNATILEDVFMEPQKPLAQIRNQSFYIVSEKDDRYTIRPQGVAEITGRFGVYVAAKLSTLNVEGGEVVFENKNPAGYSNSTNIYWQFIPVTAAQPSTVTVTQAPVRSPSVIVTPPSGNKLEIDFKTGGDNLEPRGFQKNLQLSIAVRNRAPIVMDDVNKNQTWPNNSMRRVSVPLPADVYAQDLLSITLTRTVVSTWNNVDAGIADNWNLDGITATAIVKADGRINRTTLLNAGGAPLFRFIYEKRNNSNPKEGLSTSFPLAVPLPDPISRATPNGQMTVNAIFGTGGDDLRGGNDNVEIIIKLRTTPARTVYIRNLNNGQNWPNNSERTVSKPITGAAFNFNDIESIELRHTGGGGYAADNWYLDKFKLTMNLNGESRVLVDVLKAPEHYFTGDTRRKTYRFSN